MVFWGLAGFVEPARATAQAWRIIAGIIAIIATWMAVALGLYIGLNIIMGHEDILETEMLFFDVTRPFGVLAMLATFVGLALGVILVVRFLHGRKIVTLFGPWRKMWRQFALAAIITFAAYGFFFGLWSRFYIADPGIDWGLWLKLLPFALLGVFIQTGAEEMAFRGYLLQNLAARFATPLIWLCGTSVFFGLAHYDPGIAGQNAWLIALTTGLFGLIAADLTAATGTIGGAWGMHFANNCMALLILSTRETFTGLALFLTPYQINDQEAMLRIFISDMALLLVIWLVLRRSLAR